MSAPRQVDVFLNPRSGARQVTPARLAELFAAAGCTATLFALRRSLDLPALARSRPPHIPFIAAGGDGTVNAIAQVVAGTARPFGVLPLGTLNHFVRDTGLPLALPDAVRIAAGDCVRNVDAAQVNGHIFVNNSSLGAYPMMVMDRERMRKGGRAKWVALALASLRTFLRFRRLSIQMTLADGEHRCITPFLFVGNNEYCLDGGRLGQRDHVDRGELALYWSPGATRVDTLRLMLAAVLGRVRQDHPLREQRLTAFSVQIPRRRIRVSLDGEVRRLPGPLHYRTLPGALQLLVPRPEPAP